MMGFLHVHMGFMMVRSDLCRPNVSFTVYSDPFVSTLVRLTRFHKIAYSIMIPEPKSCNGFCLIITAVFVNEKIK